MTTIQFRDKTFQVQQGSMHPGFSFYTFEVEEKDIRDQYWTVQAGDVVLDVGASYGSYALSACAMGATVYAFEPESSIANDLLTNVHINGWDDSCHVYVKGIYSSRIDLHMNAYAPHWAPESISGPYQLSTLDSFIAEVHPAKVDWIKIDIEGAETHAILGGLKLIRTFKPKMLIECHTFLDNTVTNQVKGLIGAVAEYEFTEIQRDPCVMLLCTPKANS